MLSREDWKHNKSPVVGLLALIQHSFGLDWTDIVNGLERAGHIFLHSQAEIWTDGPTFPTSLVLSYNRDILKALHYDTHLCNRINSFFMCCQFYTTVTSFAAASLWQSLCMKMLNSVARESVTVCIHVYMCKKTHANVALAFFSFEKGIIWMKWIITVVISTVNCALFSTKCS